MRDAHIYNFKRCLPRMSWSPVNLYNLYRRSLTELKDESIWKSTTETLFQQRWKSKALVRAYHGDFIPEKIFKRWYLPNLLPDVRPRTRRSTESDVVGLAKWSRKDGVADREEKALEEERTKGLAPVGSLMFTEVERRIDVVIFRACMAPSVYEARRLVIHGDVLLNGKKHQNANTRLAPGDMVSVDPAAIRFLQKQPEPAAKAEEKVDKVANSSDAEVEASSTESSPSETETVSAPTTAASPKPEPTKDAPALVPIYKTGHKHSNLTPFELPEYASPFIFIPAYLETSFNTCSVIYLRHPTARPGYSEIPTPYDADGEIVRFAWEWYAQRRPRIRSQRQKAREPENRK